MIRTEIEASLEGFDVGLSGAVPLRAEWTEPAQDRGILEFVSLLSGLIFKYRGRVVHGAHPTFTPVILRQAELHGQNSCRPVATIVVSNLWARHLPKTELERMQRHAEVIVVPQVGEGTPDDPTVRNASLSAMRRRLVSLMNVLVAVGGMRHKGTSVIPGVEEEINLARNRGMACFVVGGLGGMAADIAASLRIDASALRNGLSSEDNNLLLSSLDVAGCASSIFEHLSRNHDLAKRPLADLG